MFEKLKFYLVCVMEESWKYHVFIFSQISNLWFIFI